MRDEVFTLSKIKSYKNMPDLVAESLKEAIMRGEFKGGIQLKQDEIARQFDVSLIPVREALIQLEGMGLVKCIRNKGAIVTTLSLKEMKHLFELRKVLELGCVMLVKDQIPEFCLEKLELIVGKIEQTEDLFTFTKYNRLFYLLLCDLANNSELNDMYEKMFVRIERYLNCIFYVLPEIRCEKTHYKQVLKLLKEKDFEQLARLIKEHIENIEEKFTIYLTSNYSNIEQLDWNRLLPFE